MTGRSTTSHTIGRLPPELVASILFKSQHDLPVPGTFCSPLYVCLWYNCQFSLRRTTDNNSHFDAVVSRHLVEHAKQIREGGPCRCLWAGCPLELKGGQSLRNYVRHLMVHVPWYYLCAGCGAFNPRVDQPKKCLEGSCLAKELIMRYRIAELKRVYGDLSSMNMAYFYKFVFREEFQ